MTAHRFANLPIVLFAFLIISLNAACSSDSSSEEDVPDGPLVPAISMEYPASDANALAQANTTCKNHKKSAKLDKTVQRGGVNINVYQCQ